MSLPILEMRFALTVPDFDQAVRFYQEQLGLPVMLGWDNGAEGRGVVLEVGRATLELIDEAQAATIDKVEAGQRVSGLIRLAIQVPDLQAGGQTLAQTEAKPIHESVLTPWGDENQRWQTPDGLQLTLFEVKEE